jgi:hypothetical protein
VQEAGKSTKDEFRSFFRIANVECTAIEWVYERVFDENAKPLKAGHQVLRMLPVANRDPRTFLIRTRSSPIVARTNTWALEPVFIVASAHIFYESKPGS